MPLYVYNIYEDQAAYAPGGHADIAMVMQLHQEFAEAVKDSGATVVAGEALAPISTASFLRGTCTPDVHVVDNPLPDVKEVLGGFYLVDVADDAAAQELAKLCPAPYGYIEARPVFVWT